MLKFFPDHYKTKKISKHAVKKLPYILRYVPDEHKSFNMDDKVILERNGLLLSFPDCYKNKEICDKAVDKYLDVLEFDC